MHKTAGEFMRAWNEEIAGDDRAVAGFAKPGKRAQVDVSSMSNSIEG